MIKETAVIPLIKSPKSSLMPNFTAAIIPIIDHINGMIRITMGNFLSVHNNIPRVKIVVGQGRPKVGDPG